MTSGMYLSYTWHTLQYIGKFLINKGSMCFYVQGETWGLLQDGIQGLQSLMLKNLQASNSMAKHAKNCYVQVLTEKEINFDSDSQDDTCSDSPLSRNQVSVSVRVLATSEKDSALTIYCSICLHSPAEASCFEEVPTSRLPSAVRNAQFRSIPCLFSIITVVNWFTY